MKFFKYIMIFFLAGYLSSCGDKYLNISPTTDLTDKDLVKSLDDLDNVANGLYNKLKLTSGAYDYYYTSYFMFSGDLMGDHFRTERDWTKDYYMYNSTPYDVSSIIYRNLYSVCYTVNKVQEAAKSLEHSEIMDSYLAEMRTLRALMYFDVVRLYAPLPSNWGKGQVGEDPMGVYLAKTEMEDIRKPTYRNSARDVWEYIGSELTESVPSLSKNKKKGRFDWYAGRAFQARYYLYMENWGEALKAALDVINSHEYSLYEMKDYVNVWKETFTSESIFEIVVSETEPNQWVSLGTLVGGTRYHQIGTTKDFEKLMQEAPDDVRCQLYVYWPTQEYYVARWKYEGRGNNELVVNPKVFRLSEMYLIAAEAAMRSGDPKTGGKYLSDLREKRTTDEPRKYDKGITLDDILYERSLELACEGHRAWDLWRNERSVVRWTTPEEKLAKRHIDNLGVIPFDHFRRVWPLPYREIQLLPEADKISQQNPGY